MKKTILIILILITAIILSWRFGVLNMVCKNIPTSQKTDEELYQEIKKQKEMEYRAEMEMANEMLNSMNLGTIKPSLPITTISRQEILKKILDLKTQINIATTKGYANDKAGALKVLNDVRNEVNSLLKNNDYKSFQSELNGLLEKVQETSDSVTNTQRIY